jgi:hypothetical protein
VETDGKPRAELGLDGDRVCRDNFLLPYLGEKLRLGAANIHQGQGLLLVRGMKPGAYSVADNVMAYLGISSYIGDKRGMQNKEGNMLCKFVFRIEAQPRLAGCACVCSCVHVLGVAATLKKLRRLSTNSTCDRRHSSSGGCRGLDGRVGRQGRATG